MLRAAAALLDSGRLPSACRGGKSWGRRLAGLLEGLFFGLGGYSASIESSTSLEEGSSKLSSPRGTAGAPGRRVGVVPFGAAAFFGDRISSFS